MNERNSKNILAQYLYYIFSGIRLSYGCLRLNFWRLRGARIGLKSRLHSGLSINYPWNLKVGNSSVIGRNCTIINCKSIKELPTLRIGDYVRIGHNVTIEANYDIEIRDNTLIAPNCYITDSTHNYSNKQIPIKKQGGEYSQVITSVPLRSGV